MYAIDINCDLGESFGSYKLGNDEKILDYVTSANIACGFHAGDPTTMRKTVTLALEKNVGIGAHPGFQDLVGFGRRKMSITPSEAYDLVLYQIGALYSFVTAEGGRLQHVKPHGALYNMAAQDPNLAEAIAMAVYKMDPQLILFGLAGSELIKAGEKLGLRTASEVFADRTYQADGTLTSRQQANALITDPTKAISQIIQMVKERKVQSLQEIEIKIKAETVCIHGDSSHALQLAKQMRTTLTDVGIKMEKISKIID